MFNGQRQVHCGTPCQFIPSFTVRMFGLIQGVPSHAVNAGGKPTSMTSATVG